MSDDLAARLEEAWGEAGDRLGIDAEDLRATLQDWGWSGPPDTAPDWLV